MLKDFYELTDDYADYKIRTNYHGHNYLCGHAGGTVSDYVREAVRKDYEVIGISDHCASPLGTAEPYITPSRIPELYLPQFAEAKRKYGAKIEILSAVEIEYFAGHAEYYKRLLSMLDYLVLGQHEYILNGVRKDSFWDGVDEANIIAYFENAIAGLRSGFFSVFAHPDVIFYRHPEITAHVAAAFERTVKTAVECDVPLELNANGIRYHYFNYPTDLLVDLCEKYNAKVVISSDCHSPDVLRDECVSRLYDYAVKRRLYVVS